MGIHHAYFIAAGAQEGITRAQEFVENEMGMKVKANPDVIVFKYGLLSVDDAREIVSFASQAPLVGDEKAVIIAAKRAYHEAQNALLKLFEEPSEDTKIFFILPMAGMLLPTLRSRIALLPASLILDGRRNKGISEIAQAFMAASREERTTIIKNLASGRDEDERRENRDEALAILEGVERALLRQGFEGQAAAALSDIATLRGYLYDRSASVRMILEHVSLVLPKNLL